ncbi:hypothetical protein Neosp_008112 [[Neocosmospora] mangrovei]
MAASESLGRLKDVWESCKAQDVQKAALIESRRLEISSSLIDQAHREKWELIQKQFLDDFVRQGMAGGKKAAQALKEAIKTQWPAHSRREIITHIYANMRGLGTTYEGNGVVSSLLDWYAFVSGFNMVDPMFDYLDAGSGKECADYKIKRASADNGYARLLGKYAGDKDSQERIALIEGPSFARELKEIADQFETCSFVNVFASQTLHKPSFLRASLPTIQPISDSGFRPQKRHRSTSPIEASPIVRNKNGDRIDPPLPGFSNEAYQQVKGWKVCNYFYLRATTPIASPGTPVVIIQFVLAQTVGSPLKCITWTPRLYPSLMSMILEQIGHQRGTNL